MEGNFDIKNLTPEQLNAALACKTTEELIAFAGKNGIKLTEEQAEKYLAQMTEMDVDLSDAELKNIAGGGCGGAYNCDGHCLVNKW